MMKNIISASNGADYHSPITFNGPTNMVNTVTNNTNIITKGIDFSVNHDNDLTIQSQNGQVIFNEFRQTNTVLNFSSNPNIKVTSGNTLTFNGSCGTVNSLDIECNAYVVLTGDLYVNMLTVGDGATITHGNMLHVVGESGAENASISHFHVI